MLNQLEEDSVRKIVEDFMANSLLFTALDISNEAKKVFPHLRHREVRDTVRALFTTHIEPAGWARSNIQVVLEDQSVATAILYHPLSASWDLDTLYDTQKRAQVSNRPQAPAVPAPVASTPSIPLSPATVLPTNPPVAQATPAARDLWNNLFQSQPSLFPRR